LLSLIEIALSSEYESKTETSMGLALPLYASSPPPSQTPSPIDSPPPYHNMSQLNLHEIIRQQQEQLAAMQVQIQALLAAQGRAGEREGAVGSRLVL